VLVAAGTLLSAGTLPYASILIGAIFGAVFGDAVSYWLGRNFGGGIARVWPFSRHPELLSRGILFFERHGGKSVFIGRFFGPVRAVVPLAAGIMQMPRGRFWLAIVFSALVCVLLFLLVCYVVGAIEDRLCSTATTM